MPVLFLRDFLRADLNFSFYYAVEGAKGKVKLPPLHRETTAYPVRFEPFYSALHGLLKCLEQAYTRA